MTGRGSRSFLGRRGFLMAALAAVGVGLLWLLSGRRRRRDARVEREATPAASAPRSDREQRVLAIVAAHVDYLRIDDGVAEAFARDFAAHDRRRALETGRIVRRFLLSTDFFENGADESRVVRYVAYYDPYVSPCRNPVLDPGRRPARVGGLASAGAHLRSPSAHCASADRGSAS